MSETKETKKMTAGERLAKALGISEEDMTRYHERKRKEREDALADAEKILAENNINPDDIPGEMMIQTAANELMRHVRQTEEELPVGEDGETIEVPGWNRRHVWELCRGLQNANDVYEKACCESGVETVLDDEEKQRLEYALCKAGAICGNAFDNLRVGEIVLYAHSIVYYETKDFIQKTDKDLEAAKQLIAAHKMRDTIVGFIDYYRVLVTENRIRVLDRCFAHKRHGVKLPEKVYELMLPAAAKENLELFEKAAEEIDQVLNHSEEAFGYKLNYIKSGKTAYHVYRWNGQVDKGQENEECPMGTMWVEEKGDYPTEEEAKRVAEEGDEIKEYDPEEMWAIVCPKGNNPTNKIYPYREDAVVDLIRLLGEETLPNWFAWEAYLDEKEKEEAYA